MQNLQGLDSWITSAGIPGNRGVVGGRINSQIGGSCRNTVGLSEFSCSFPERAAARLLFFFEEQGSPKLLKTRKYRN
jgi:hypothetical protein